MVNDEDLLLAVLNSAPVVAGRPTDELSGAAGKELAARYGGTGSPAELAQLRRMRECLQDAVRESKDALSRLSTALGDGVLVPRVTPQGLRWEVRAPEDERLAFRTAIAWSRVLHELPGRLRACANNECNLFLIDRSRPGTAKWCSMAVCGNRMKARTHAGRQRAAADRP
ncbi:CGNR zinc finger domain-containing protein [Arthrobacter sp. zg-Y769]|uniref:CGNR zinc finger domain-containing protein n=1 Tax=Arthrobacter sp. zg-Y769 TaxID=2894191 RepID=UPI001E5B5C93|nr:CGNR zinc finger domain-containing protein [Arthrobacter sp. zg-Y769]MCC9205004.1 CGNR zinc finger domain-containing protein [Arthrobacter sp. zg-Y769]